MSSSNMKTVILEQDPNAVLNFIGFTPGDGANPVLKESLRLLNILTPFHPVLPVQDIPTIKSKGDEHSGQSWSRNTFFFNSKTEYHRKHQVIIFHQSIKFNKNISFFPVSLTPIWNRQFGPPFAHQLVQGHCHLFKLEMMLIRKNL